MNKLHCTSTLPLCTIARVLRRIDHTHTRYFDFNTWFWSMIKGPFHEKNIPKNSNFMEITFSIIQLLAFWSWNFFFHAMISLLSWNMQNFIWTHSLQFWLAVELNCMYIYYFISIKFWIMGEKFRVKWPWRLSKGLCGSFAALTQHCSHMMQNIKIPFLYPPKRSLGGYTGFTLFVRPSVRPSVSVCSWWHPVV